MAKIETVEISATDLQNNSITAWLLYPYIVDPVEFKSTFSKLGVNVENKGDLKYLKKAYDEKLDIHGKILNAKKQRIYFDILKICKNINLSKLELSNAIKNKLIKFVK